MSIHRKMRYIATHYVYTKRQMTLELIVPYLKKLIEFEFEIEKLKRDRFRYVHVHTIATIAQYSEYN